MYMKLKYPMRVRLFFAEQKRLRTIAAIAHELGISSAAVSRALSGKSINKETAQLIAAAIGEEVMTITEVVNH